MTKYDLTAQVALLQVQQLNRGFVSDFHVITHVGDDAACLHPVGEIDMPAAEHLEVAQRRAIDAFGVSQVIVDLDRVTMLSLTGLAMLVDGQRHALACGVRYWVVNAHGIVARVIALTGLTAVLGSP